MFDQVMTETQWSTFTVFNVRCSV